jgi:NADH-quinone oxidoreductase subunit K
MMLTLHNCLATYLAVGALLFALGIYGMVSRRTIIGMLIASELILAGASVNFMAFNHFLAPNPVMGQICTLFIMAIAAAEAAIAMSIVVAVYRNYRGIETDTITDLHG